MLKAQATMRLALFPYPGLDPRMGGGGMCHMHQHGMLVLAAASWT
jgi:hypothetical protein